MPSRSISNLTMSPSFNHGPCAFVNFNKHAVPTVPEPITSPGKCIMFSDARARRSPDDPYKSLKLPRDLCARISKSKTLGRNAELEIEKVTNFIRDCLVSPVQVRAPRRAL